MSNMSTVLRPTGKVFSRKRAAAAWYCGFLLAVMSFSQVLASPDMVGASRNSEPGDRPPNIILIMADDFGIRSFEQQDTPQLDRMAREGVSFDFAQSTPLCTPSRVQIMTGQYSFRNYTGFGKLRPGETTFAHVLKAAGYRTTIVGKWQLGGNAYAPYGFGFDDYCLWQLTFGGYHERYHNPRIIRNGEVVKYSNGEYGPRLFTDHLLEFVAENRDRPFFAYFPMALPHRPMTPTPDTPGYLERVGSSNQEVGSSPEFFGDQVRYMDRLVGEILDRLRELGLAENTLVLFTTDNGTGDEISVDLAGRKVPGQKGLTNLLGTHVPLIAWGPGSVPAGERSSRLVDFTDVLPTLAEAAGTKLPPDLSVDGVSFYHQLLGQAGPERDWVFCHYDPGKAHLPVARFVFNREWKLYEDGRVFHLAEDPLEEYPRDVAVVPAAARSILTDFESVLQRMR
jgi:arylsulfatase A